jgi:hypothetical protein
MKSFVQKIRRRLRKSVLQYGVVATIGRCLIWPAMYLSWRLVELTPYSRNSRRAGREFDATFGVDTERDRLSEWASDVDSPNWSEGVGYDPTPLDSVRGSIERLPIRLEEFVFIDLGSGKGRVLLAASDFPFREIIGVEYARDLHEIAERNIAVYSSPTQACTRLRSVCHDAATYSLPLAPLVLFFAHPFGDKILREFLAHLGQSMKSAPREVYVVYYDPICGDLFEAAGFCEVDGHALPSKQLLPEFVYTRLRWFELIGFRNRKGREYTIFRSPSTAGEPAS